PNGALVASIDLLHNYVYEIRNAIARTDAKYVLVDTPGQLELFAYRIASMEVMKRILNPYTSVALFLIDSVFAQRPSSLISLLLLSQSVRLRHGLPQIDALSKADMLTPELAKLLDDLEESSDLLIELLRGESGAPARLAQRLVEIIAEDGLKILRVSSHDPDSLWNVFEEIQRTLGAEEELEELEER
ncbi:MAG: ATP/GTP-binding protein, partial [Fervidicoccaceae archaeon]